MRTWLFVVALLVCAHARADAQAADPGQPSPVAPDEAAPPADSLLRGRVFERGSVMPIAGVRIVTAEGVEVTTDAKGRFELRLPHGKQPLAVMSDDYDLLHVTETLVANEGLNVEYRLTPRDEKKRYRSRTRGAAHHEGERFSLRDEELHNAPGTLGDPFHAIALMPGVAVPIPLLPLWVVRGASPGTNGFFLDGMRVPQLFHLLVGGGVVSADMVDRVDFYASGYDATFGRFSGGIVDAETRPAKDGYHGQIELKVYDVGGLVELTLPHDVKLTIGGHYAWPGFIVHLVDPKADLGYWDFQLRLDWKGLTVEALGSFDSLSFEQTPLVDGVKQTIEDRYRLAFYRLQIRDRERWGRVELETGIVGGIDQVAAFGGAGVNELSLNFRANLGVRWKRFRLLFGAEFEIQRFTPENFSPGLPGAEPDELGEFGGHRGGIVAGGYAEGIVDIVPSRLQATLGGHIEVYNANGVTLLGLDPRFQLKAQLLPQLRVHASTGIYQQAPSFPIGLPGVDTFALQLGLQRAWQTAVGLEANLPKGVDFSLTGYYNKFHNVNDVVLDFGQSAACSTPPPESLTGLPAEVVRQLDGASYGMEVLLRRKLGRVTGWLSYTLSKSERVYSCGLRPSDFDQRHILNAVVQVRLPWKLMVGAHLYFASGRPYTSYAQNGLDAIRNDARLPNYVQLDLRIDREWLFKKWALSAFIEVLNATFSTLYFGPALSANPSNAATVLDELDLKPFRWILPTIGVKARL